MAFSRRSFGNGRQSLPILRPRRAEAITPTSFFSDNLWNEYSDMPFEEVDVPAAEKEKIRKLVYFEPDPGVTHAASFIARVI